MKFLLSILFVFITLSFSNELKNSTSPYLLQHKDNPVNWMEWSDRAFEKAKKENKFIFLSIGYSTCHWCHVMARESFSQKDVANILNKYFVSIKVDKERLSDIDNYYQLGYRIVNNRAGGWPLTVILLPNKKPVYFGTYMPKDALIELLNKIIKTDKAKLTDIANDIQKAITLSQKDKKVKKVPLKATLLKKAYENIKSNFDSKNGGFSRAPKFPQANTINLLLNSYLINGNKDALNMATKTLDAMAQGGIYDQIDGAFFRYSVDEKWEIPHFEKMLYTNAELLSVYVKAYKITKSKLYERVIKETIKEIDRRFLQNGLYYSASNADSKDKNGIQKEGYFFVYNYDKTLDFLVKNGISKTRAKETLNHFGIKPDGNFKGGDFSNPTRVKFNPKFERERHLLSKYREQKEYPFIDKKINTAWNALYIKAKLEAGIVDKSFTKEALMSLHKLLDLMYKKETLYHQTLLPNKPSQDGLLEDYSFVSDALFTAYQKTLDDNYLQLFKKLTLKSLQLFYKNNTWYQSTNTEFKVKATIDSSSYKSALAVNLENILKYVAISGDYKAIEIVNKTINTNSFFISAYPQYYPTALNIILMQNKGIYIIKGPKIGLLKSNIESEIKYPFVYKKDEQSKEYTVCGLKSCYSSNINLEKVLLELKKLVN